MGDVPTPIYHPAECSRCCEDPECPYMHWESWEVNGEHYRTEAEALRAITGEPS